MIVTNCGASAGLIPPGGDWEAHMHFGAIHLVGSQV